MDKKKKPILTISLLTSNRPDTVQKCLESLTPLREAIPCELIITDTSKEPVIREIIEQYADRIYEFEWCNDFSKARNLGLSKAKGEWFMYVDDDEWFVDLTDMIEFFRSREYKKYGYANYKTRDFIDPGLNYYSETWASRMIRIDVDTHFKSKIHEHFEPVRGKLKSLNSYTHHVGYIYKSEEDLIKHFNRNEPLLREMMEEEPDNLRWQIQLVQEYRNIKAWNRNCKFCEAQLQKNKTVNNKYDNIHLGTLYAGYAEALVFLKDYDKCIEICQLGLTDKRSTEATKAYLHLKLMEAHFWRGDLEKAKGYVEIYFQESLELPKQEHLWVEQNVALLVNEVFDETNIKKAYSIWIGCDLLSGSTKTLIEHYDKLEWGREVIYVYDDIEKIFLEAISKLPFEPIFAQVITDALKNQEFKRLLMESLKVLSKKNAKQREVLCHALAKASYWDEISIEQWEADVRACLSVIDSEHKEVFIDQMKANYDVGNWRNAYLELVMWESDIIIGPQTPSDILKYTEVLNVYVDKVLQFYSLYYIEEAFFNFPEVLPKKVQAAIKFMEFAEMENKMGAQALYLLQESANLYPEYSVGIRKFIEYYLELEEHKEEISEEENGQQTVLSAWMMQVEGYVKQGFPELARMRPCVEEEFSSNDIRYLYFMKYYGSQLIRLESDSESFELLYKRFFEYMECILGYYLCIFRDAAFQGEMELLPNEAKVAVVLHRMFSREENDWVNKVRDLRECIQISPSLANNVKRLVNMINK